MIFDFLGHRKENACEEVEDEKYDDTFCLKRNPLPHTLQI